MTEKTMTAGNENPYSNPMMALPTNQKMPYPAVNNPYAEARCDGATMGATAAGIMDSCTPMPKPQSAIPINAAQNPPKNTSGANSMATSVKIIKMKKPKRS